MLDSFQKSSVPSNHSLTNPKLTQRKSECPWLVGLPNSTSLSDMIYSLQFITQMYELPNKNSPTPWQLPTEATSIKKASLQNNPTDHTPVPTGECYNSKSDVSCNGFFQIVQTMLWPPACLTETIFPKGGMLFRYHHRRDGFSQIQGES